MALIVNAAGAVATIPIAIPLIIGFGLNGACIALCLANAVRLVVLHLLFTRMIATDTADASSGRVRDQAVPARSADDQGEAIGNAVASRVAALPASKLRQTWIGALAESGTGGRVHPPVPQGLAVPVRPAFARTSIRPTREVGHFHPRASSSGALRDHCARLGGLDMQT